MVAQRNSLAKITAIDINEKAAELTRHNFQNSPFAERMAVFKEDFKKFKINEAFDLIVCNPPYFEPNNSEKDIVARQKIELQFDELIQQSAKFLNEKGVFAVIIPSSQAFDFIQLCEQNQLFLTGKINIFGIEGGSLRRNILEFSRSEKKTEQEDFIIEKSPRQYSDQYLELTKEFHIFKEK